MKKAIIFALTGLALVVTSFYSPIVCAEDTEDFLFQKNVTYSGVEGGKQGDNWKYPQFVGEKAVDGDVSTRWSADKTDNQWLTVDIGEEKTIGQVVLHFHAESPEYEVLVSNDNQNYQSIYKEERGSGGKEAKKYIEVANVTARYIKYQQLKMWKHTNGQYYGSSIISMEAYRQARLPDGIKFSIDSAEISEKRSKQLTYILTPTGVQVPEKQIEWSSSDPSIVNVDSQGRMKALKTGEAKVTVRIKNTDLSDTIPVTVIQEKAEYREMREKWKARLLGSKEDHEEFDQDSDVKKYRARIAKDSLELWQTLNKSENRTYLWEKKSSDTLSADYTTQFTNIKKLTLGYYDPSSSLHKNQEVFTQILKAIDFMIETKNYNGTYWSGNWWDWQIGSAQPLTDTLILLHDVLIEKDDAILTKFVEPLNHYAQDPKVQWPSYTATGANLTDISITVLGTAILLENDSRVEAVQSAVPSVLKMVTGGDGLYSDGSLIQHSHFPYNGSYGNELLKGFLFDSKGLKGSSRSITIKVPSEVDKTALEKIVEENQNRNESDYTKESWKVFTKAMELAQAVLTDPKATQAEVDEAVQAVRKAIEQLQEVTKVDKTALEKLVEENQNRNESDYTKESWKVFTKAMELAQAVLTDPKATQAEVDDAVQAVRKAVEQLQEVTKVDKTALEKLVEENQNRNESDYTKESWKVFTKAMELAQAVLTDPKATQAEVDDAVQAVRKAIEQLQEVTKVDKTALKKLVEENQNRVASGYTAESWQVFRKALEAAQAVLADSNTTQAEVDEAIQAVNKAIEQLQEVTKVDKTALKKLVEENQSRVASSYTAESWQVFRKALEAAQAVLADSNTTQAEVELVMNDLVQAIEQLENKETASSSEEDKNINNKAEQGKNTQEGNNEIGKSSISEETGKEGLLPKTGEKNNQVIQKLGYTILLVVFVSLFLLKGRKESKRS
ncbi:FIVAR domain-containing protein [Enterococcus hirae]